MKKRLYLEGTIWLLVICSALIFSGASSISTDKALKRIQKNSASGSNTWVVVDTGQDSCFNNYSQVSCPFSSAAFYGQDSQYNGVQPDYTDNGNGTILDNNTGLMWQKDPGSKMTWDEAAEKARSFNLAGYTDWRLPSIKELYSLIDFNGVTGMSESTSIPYIDTKYFNFKYGDESAGERMIDAQYASSTEYVSTTMNGNATIFGVNFADGRIKGYPKYNKTYYVLYVRGNPGYGVNSFTDNGDGTITDKATGLMWMQKDSGHLKAGDKKDGKLNWQQALAWAESLDYAGHSDWRLPNAKELQGIVDYTRSPDTTRSPAIDPVFNTTSITDGYGQVNYPYFWTGTTHMDGREPGSTAVYIAFGEAQGYMQSYNGYTLMDVHGAGAQRSDPKDGDPNDFPYGRGPQGDVIAIYNFARCVRTATSETAGPKTLTVLSSPTGVTIGVSPSDNNGSGNGSAAFTRSFSSGTEVTLTAPSTSNQKTFSKWLVGSTSYTYPTVKVTMDSDLRATAYYTGGNDGTTELVFNRDRFNFRSIDGGETTPPQILLVNNSSEDAFQWSVTDDAPWLILSETSGTGAGKITITVDSSGLAAGSYHGVITVICAQASNSPQTAAVHLEVLSSGKTPFGSFDTPAHESSVNGSIPVTGWVLDDIAVQQVSIYRQEHGTIFYIGDAVCVDGARPDVEQAYPDFPFNYRAGWGYMMLTNGLPNGGNGKYTLIAIARDVEGNTSTLGSKTITCDNANAVSPFGAIDSPDQGGDASGRSFRNQGWVLAQKPNSISLDGSSINVYVDGVNLGHPVYNVYREDIAAFFPGFANSNGAGGYFDLDTTAYQNGLHTIYWSVTDDAGNSEGIGSRYFTIQNTGNSRTCALSSPHSAKMDNQSPAAPGSIRIRHGFNPNSLLRTLPIDASGRFFVEIEELGRIEMHLGGNGTYTGNMVVGAQFRPLPTGSTLDTVNGIFYWQPGPGCKGSFDFVFILKNTGKSSEEQVMATIKIKESSIIR